MDLVALRALIDSDPVNDPPATDASVLAWLGVEIIAPRLATSASVRQYMATQAFGTGLGKRTLWDAIDEFGALGTVGGGAYAHASKEARMSAARGIIKMLAHGSEGEGFEVNDAVVKAAFVSLGNDGGNGPAILTTAQLLAIEALGKALARRDVAAGLGVAHLGDVQNARAL